MSFYFDRLPEVGRNGYLHAIINRQSEEIEALAPVNSLNVISGHRKDGVYREGSPPVEAAEGADGPQVVRFYVWVDAGEYLICRKWTEFNRGSQAQEYYVAKPYALRPWSSHGVQAIGHPAYPAETWWHHGPYPKNSAIQIWDLQRYLLVNGREVHEAVHPTYQQQVGLLPPERGSEIYAAKVTPAIVVRHANSAALQVSCDWIDLNVEGRRWVHMCQYHIFQTRVDGVANRRTAVWAADY